MGGVRRWGRRETQTASTRGERKRRDGCCLLWHTLTHHRVTAAGRREHPSIRHPLQQSKATFFFLVNYWRSVHALHYSTQSEPETLQRYAGGCNQERRSGVTAEGSFSTRDSDHGSNGGGGFPARWVQHPFDSHTSSLKCCSPSFIYCLSNGAVFARLLFGHLWLVVFLFFFKWVYNIL